MKKKINRYLLLTAAVTLTATLFMAVVIFHHMYREQVIGDLRTYTELLCSMVSSGEELGERYHYDDPELRITAISQDGRVEFDSKAQEGQLGDHSDRPEIQQAMTQGEGYAIRHSDTLDNDMYYFAMLLDSGDVLRVSKAEASVWTMFVSTIQGMALIAVLLFLICLVLARYITADVVKPIETMAEDIDNIESLDTYEELKPFITTIQQQHEDIIRGAKMRQEFTANVSHELKTPLTSISGYAELIETGIAGEQDVQRFAREIHRSSNRLLSLINDIIRLSELDSEHMECVFSEIDLYDLACTCVEMRNFHAEKHGIAIDCHGSRCMVYANKEMLEELLFNLCDNAIRYNRPGGRVDVTVRCWNGKTQLIVKDTGIGIPKEAQERVFERFYRVDKSRSKQTGGTGLGLAIVKHIVVQHRADIELKSEVGTGTEITVTFPEKG